MTKALVDTTVIIHLFRRYAPALAWYASLVASATKPCPSAWSYASDLVRGFIRRRQQSQAGEQHSYFEPV